MSDDDKTSPLARALQRGKHRYKDITTDGLEGVSIERLPAVPSTKRIKMRKEFYALPVVEQAAYLTELCSALNSALDLMQQERNSIIELCQKQEKMIEAKTQQITELQNALQSAVHNMNDEANRRAEELHEAKQRIRKLEAH